MAKIKEIFLELQNQFGLDLEDMPQDFSMDEYLKKRAEEIKNDNEVTE